MPTRPPKSRALRTPSSEMMRGARSSVRNVPDADSFTSETVHSHLRAISSRPLTEAVQPVTVAAWNTLPSGRRFTVSVYTALVSPCQANSTGFAVRALLNAFFCALVRFHALTLRASRGISRNLIASGHSCETVSPSLGAVIWMPAFRAAAASAAQIARFVFFFMFINHS